MLFLLGLTIVVGSVIGGYLGGGGHLVVLFQPFEFVIIFGAAIGASVISNPLPVVVATAKSFGALLKGSKLTKASYVELLSLLYATFKLAKTKGDLALEVTSTSRMRAPCSRPTRASPRTTRRSSSSATICGC
jgi:chemotaxis protein MotA